VAAEGTCLTAAEDICWTTAVAACLRSEVSQAHRPAPRLAIISEREAALIQNNLGLFQGQLIF